jgi:riboflavin synthase
VVSVFTGLVETTGAVAEIERGRLRVTTPLAAELSDGDSIAVNGVCLTAVAPDAEGFAADVMPETLRHTALGALAIGDGVNLELPLRAGDRLGGHVVQGHADGIGTIAAVMPEENAVVMRVSAPGELLRYVVAKGSIAVDGVSLTVAGVDGEGFSVSLIPETVARTTLGALAPGARVNLEVDVLAKYVEKLVNRTEVPA